MKFHPALIFSTVVILVVMPFHKASAQQHPIYSQYMFNGLVVNPAYTGTSGALRFTTSVRRQWTGLPGSPKTESLSVHSPISLSRSSVGLVAMRDEVSVTNQYVVYGTYAYKIPISEKVFLSAGAQAGFGSYRSDFTELTVVTGTNQPDPLFQSDQYGKILPNLGLGLYLYSQRSYVGISLPELINNAYFKSDPLIQSRQQRLILLTAGHVFDINNDLKLKPNVLLKYLESGPFQVDVNCNLLIKNTIWAGASYRLNDGVDAILEWLINAQLSMGYSYGYSLTQLKDYQGGSHEFVLNYTLKRKKNVVLSPRYF